MSNLWSDPRCRIVVALQIKPVSDLSVCADKSSPLLPAVQTKPTMHTRRAFNMFLCFLLAVKKWMMPDL